LYRLPQTVGVQRGAVRVMTASERGVWRRNCAAVLIGVVGCLQMVGYISGSRTLRGLGAASTIAPFTKVFSDVDGFEPFASEFTIRYRDGAGMVVETGITPAMVSRFGGPYNRRNVYGAALSYGPRLPASLWQPVLCHGLVSNGALRRELGLADATQISVMIRTKTRGRNDVWRLEPQCPA
jgi:hypothetical protein